MDVGWVVHLKGLTKYICCLFSAEVHPCRGINRAWYTIWICIDYSSLLFFFCRRSFNFVATSDRYG